MLKREYSPVRTLEDKIALCTIVRGAFVFLAAVFFLALFVSPFLFDISKEKVAFHIFFSFCMIAGIIASGTAAFAHSHLKGARAKLYDKMISQDK